MRVLVAEDDPALREQLRGALADAGYVVDAVDNGIDAAHLGASEPLDAVVLEPDGSFSVLTDVAVREGIPGM